MVMQNVLSKQISQYEVLDQLTASDFNLPLAAERLQMTPAAVLAALTQEAEATIINHMRLRTVLELYRAWRGTLDFYVMSLAEAEPRDVIKGFNSLTTALGEVTKATPVHNTVNQNQVVLNMLPPDAREAVLKLLESSNKE